MTGALRSVPSSWRRAATVLLAAGCTHPGRAAPSLTRPPPEGFRLLLQQRSSRGFMPGAHVFPGGVINPADCSLDWLRLFAPHHGPPRFGLGPSLPQPSTFPVLPSEETHAADEVLPDDVALRICAIRETFEEVGVLLLRPRTSLATEPELVGAFPPPPDLANWRARVRSEPHHFLRLCEHLDCTPNIWALHDWCIWLTPFIEPGGRRFNTVFYLCCLSESPPVYPDLAEVVDYKWSSPSEATESFISQQIWLAAPQFYEIRRLANFTSFSDLHKFCLDHTLEAVERWMPLSVLSADGRIQLLPGDELYVEDSDLIEKFLSIEKKTEEIMKEGKKLHRMVFHSLHAYSIYVTVQPKYKHVYPKNYVVNQSRL